MSSELPQLPLEIPEEFKRGWFELLFRQPNAPEIRRPQEVHPKHYQFPGQTLPTVEFYGVFDVYERLGVETLQDRKPDFLPRALTHGDVINLIGRHPHIVVTTHVVLSRKSLVRMRVRDERIEDDPRFMQTIVSVRKPFPSFANGNNKRN